MQSVIRESRWRERFLNHPGHSQKAPDAFKGGKVKVICKACLNAKVDEAVFTEQTAGIQSLLSVEPFIRGSRERAVIYDEVLNSSDVKWIACRKTSCLYHLKACTKQSAEICSAAEVELASENAARREGRQAKKSPASVIVESPSTLSESPAHTQDIADRRLALNNVIEHVPPMLSSESTTPKVSFPCTSIVAEEAFNVPYSAAAAVASSGSPATPTDSHTSTFPDAADEFFRMATKLGMSATSSYHVPPATWSHMNHYHSLDDGPSPGAFDGTYVRGVPLLDTGPSMMPQPIYVGWAPHIWQTEAPTPDTTTPVGDYAYSAFELDVPLANMFGGMQIASGEHSGTLEEAAPSSYHLQDPGIELPRYDGDIPPWELYWSW